MENKNRASSMEVASHGIEKTAETMGNTIVAVLDRLAGTKSDLKLSFEDLRIDAGPMKASINGSVVLDIVMAKEAKEA